MLLHLPDGYRPEQVCDALAAKIQELPEVLRRSLTWDQGPEMRDWKQVSVAADVDTYFCDPHAPWRRGTNENTNGLLRQYFPKGTDLSVHTAADLNAAADELNDRPRKRLGFRKPIEQTGRSCCDDRLDPPISYRQDRNRQRKHRSRAHAPEAPRSCHSRCSRWGLSRWPGRLRRRPTSRLLNPSGRPVGAPCREGGVGSAQQVKGLRRRAIHRTVPWRRTPHL
jgi:hypothetical protein